MKLDAIQFNTSTTDTPSWTKLVDLIYPKGCLFFTGTSDAPGELFGGTWAKLGGGAVLALEGKNGFANATNYGGSLKISVNQMPSHSHNSGHGYHDVTQSSGTFFQKCVSYEYFSDDYYCENTTSSAGGGQNYLPYHYSVKGYYRTS